MSVETKPTVLRESIGSFNASLHRLATLDVLLKGLTKEGNAKMPVYLHDTLFTPPERKYLQSSGYILFRDDDDDDSSLATMSTSTFLFVPFLRDGTISLALIDSFPALYVGIGIDRAVEHISTCDAKDLRGGRERSIHPLERFKTVSTETPRLPIFADRNQQGLERWSDARVRWLDPGYYVKKAKAADRMKKEGGGSKAGNQRTPASGAPGKGTEKIIDYWTWEPHKEGC